jgi:hypothetical protein
MTNLPPPPSSGSGESDFKLAKSEAKAAKARAKALRPWYRKKRIIIPLVLLSFPVLGGVISGITSEDGTGTEESSEPSTTTSTLPTTTTTTEPPVLWDALLPSGTERAAVVASACDATTKVVLKFKKTVDERLKATDVEPDAYTAAEFVDEYDWESVDHDGVLRSEVRRVTDPLLTEAVKPEIVGEAQLAGFLDDVVEGCGIDAEYTSLIASSQGLDNKLSTLRTRAQNLPWYPEDFGTWFGDPNLAWRWAEKGEFSCSYGDRCQAIFVASKSGCPGGLYAKINILDSSGVVVDYSNDLLSGIRPGEVAKMQFEFFTRGAGTTRLEELNCY